MVCRVSNNFAEKKKNKKKMSDPFYLPRMIVCENEKQDDCGSSDTESSTKEGGDDDALDLGECKSESRNASEEQIEQGARDEHEGDQNTNANAAASAGALKSDSRTDALEENLSGLRLDSNNGPGGTNNEPSSTPERATPVPAPTTPIVSPEKQDRQQVSTPPAHVIEVEEKDELSPLYVGRIIGKGGEMIRDLQARSGCRIDVHQDVEPVTAPRIITYRGACQEDVNFAKELVRMLCEKKDGEAHVELPLGRATQRKIQVPKSVIGRIIGRGGEMIRELQSKSHARIQVDHSGENAIDENHRQVTITGTEEGVDRAEEMIACVIENPTLDGHSLVSRRHHGDHHHGQQQHHGHHHQFGHGHEGQQQQYHQHAPVAGIPQPSHLHPTVTEDSASMMGTSPMQSATYWVGRFGMTPGQQQQGFGTSPIGAYDGWVNHAAPPPMIETDVIPCERADFGHIIGKRGATINDIQHRSSCSVQIDQRECRISISGPRQGIELAKGMIRQICESESEHPYAGGGQQAMATMQQQIQPIVLQQHESMGSSSTEPLGYNAEQQQQQYQYGYYGGQSQAQPPAAMMYLQHQQAQAQHQQQAAQAQAVQADAAESSSSPWRTATSADGKVYYYNQLTMESRWDRPAGMQ